jgi:probable AcnD-accessory protein PrpF
MRGGTSKGLFFLAKDLPADKAQRDRLLARLIGSPDPYARHTDGLGGATSSTSKVVLISPSLREDCDIDYLFGAVAIESGLIDWSGNCGNLSAAVGPFSISAGLVAPREGQTTVRIWQQNIQKKIIAHVPTHQGEVVEDGAFMEDGVPFAGAEIVLEFIDPADSGKRGLLPSGAAVDEIEVAELGRLRVSLINAGNATVFVRAQSLQLSGKELPEVLNRDLRLLARLEAIRAHAAVAMGLARSVEDASKNRPATPKLAWVAAPAGYRNSAGVDIDKGSIDILARIVSMGKVHHAFTGTGSIALAAAAALPGTIVSEVARTLPGLATRIGHPSGILTVAALLNETRQGWRVEKATMSRSARRLMQGEVFVPPA